LSFVLRDIRLIGSSATGTDGIYMDGVNSFIRSVLFDNVNILNFSGYGIHSVGTVFDIVYNHVGVFSHQNDNIYIEPSTGIPSQHWFYGCTSLINAVGKYALKIVQADTCGIFGGVYANDVGGGNGVYIKDSGGITISGANIEGIGSGYSELGLLYTGTGLEVIGGTIVTWSTGVQIGEGTSAQASG